MAPTVLADAAFGATPGSWPLPSARDATELWLRAVAAGGQGRYACARADLARLLRTDHAGELASLALSTRASFLRQLGWHWRAHRWDGEALAVAGSGVRVVEARVDAMAGLAADALGVGRLAASAELLDRARDALAEAENPAPRLPVRLAWVGAELAMMGGDGSSAVAHARRGVESAEDAGCRHKVKSQVVLAAALCTAGDLPASRRVADAALAQAHSQALTPLRWALASLLADIGSDVHDADAIAGIRAGTAAFVTHNGGRWRSG